MAKVIVLQHVAYEILGTINPLLRKLGIRIKYINFGRNSGQRLDLDRMVDYDGLVILGGPMNVDQADQYPHIHHEIELIQTAMANDIPILGICLGAQLIAKACGATVTKHSCKEIGWYPVQLTQEGKKDVMLRHFNDQETVFQWHGDTFALPERAVSLVEAEACVNQAFRIKKNVYGLQFHLEVDEPLIERWLTVPQYLTELATLKGKTNKEEILARTHQHISRTTELSSRVFLEFCKMIGRHQQPIHFASR